MATVAAVVVAGHAWVLQAAANGRADDLQASAASIAAARADSGLSAPVVQARWITEPHRPEAPRLEPGKPGESKAVPRTKPTTAAALLARRPSSIGTQVPAAGLALVAATSADDAAADPPRQLARAAALTPSEPLDASPGPAEVVDVPTYRTKPPASVHLSYELRRGMIAGTGDFDWKSDGGSYEMRLDGKVAGFSLLSWVSKGGFDAAGLAPVRYTDQRRNKQTLAANFQRGQGVITYSQPQTEHTLVPGSQDRLSWMIQLPSILAADPSLGKAGSHVAMFVTGARGDADVWSFRVVAHEPVSTPGGSVDAIHMLREARKPHDTQVDVWLDPNRAFLPVHAQMANEGGGEAFELSLK